MNERIRELVTATDAWCDQNFPPDWTDRVDEFLPLWNAKFAELIVKECADIATMNQYQSYTPGHYVLKHFGVEE